MNVASSFSTQRNSRSAAQEAFAELRDALGTTPDFLFLAATESHDFDLLARVLSKEAPEAAIHGCSSCAAVMTAEGFHRGEGAALSLFGLSDPKGAFGTGAAPLRLPAEEAAQQAVLQALEQAGRSGELPRLVWLSASPGKEEAIISGIEALLGENVPIIGGSAADNDLAGKWRVFAGEEAFGEAVVVSVLFPTTEVMYAFHSGYEPTEHRGRVTGGEGRQIQTIDGRPAREVFEEWLDSELPQPTDSEVIVLSETTMTPLGRKIDAVDGAPTYLLAHPWLMDVEGAMHFFAEFSPGEEITLMEGTKKGLIERAGRVALSALDIKGRSVKDVAGGLVIFCAGCMRAVESEAGEVVDSINAVLGGRPFLGLFTYGEQGCFYGGENRHGNLMISVLLFGRSSSAMEHDGSS